MISNCNSLESEGCNRHEDKECCKVSIEPRLLCITAKTYLANTMITMCIFLTVKTTRCCDNSDKQHARHTEMQQHSCRHKLTALPSHYWFDSTYSTCKTWMAMLKPVANRFSSSINSKPEHCLGMDRAWQHPVMCSAVDLSSLLTSVSTVVQHSLGTVRIITLPTTLADSQTLLSASD